MEEKKPMSSEQKTKLISFIIVCCLIIVVGLVFIISTVVQKSNQDPEGFNNNFQKVADGYKLKSWGLSGNEFRIDVDGAVWDSMNYSKKEDYCNKIFGYTKELLWKHHFYDEPNTPHVKFYNGTICAEIIFDRLVVY